MPLYTPFTGIAGVFAYDAVEPTTRRQAPVADLRNEDDMLRWHERDKLVSTARDAKRNWVVAAWMIRKHLDFVSEFGFEPNTPNDEFNRLFRERMKKWGKRKQCHISRRHPLRRLIRINEACRVMDGDVLWELMKAGSVNLIRGDRIRNRYGDNRDGYVHGVRVGTDGAALGFQVHKRGRWGRFTFEKNLPAHNAILNGYYDDCEQIRGVSPLAQAINNLRDTYEGIDFALARLKVEQILGVAITKKFEDGYNPWQGNRQFETTDGDTEESVEAVRKDEERSGNVDFGKGLWQIDLLPGEDIKHVAGQSPSSNAQQFLDACIHLALKALDLPVSFWNEAHTNFFGSRGALQLYKRSAHNKQADNQDVLEELTRWKLIQWVIDGEIDLPRGWHVDDVEFAWVPRGIPWWDRSKEIIGDLRAIGAGLDNPIDVCLDHGTGNPFDHIRKTKKVLEFAQQELGPLGMQLSFSASEDGDSGKKKSQSEDDDE